MTEFRCERCQKNFDSEESLQQHNRDEHGAGIQQSKHEIRQLKKQERENQKNMERRRIMKGKKIKRVIYVTIPLIIAAAAFIFISSQPSTEQATTEFISASKIPNFPIHWHPTLEVIIKGQKQTIPANLGTIGVHQPIHTHDLTGELHYENSNPTPENMPLRYFFEIVWRKTFNDTCIMDHCNDETGTVKMFVNGRQSFEFENYIPKDKDEIVIEFS
ncbi:MAG: hypothetical protein HYT73_02865 [Candidatus Aenigmarchaeota archaeon]|nr:hypothetical protein [Candidatus Aenigmarchaeota archaeon]